MGAPGVPGWVRHAQRVGMRYGSVNLLSSTNALAVVRTELDISHHKKPGHREARQEIA